MVDDAFFVSQQAQERPVKLPDGSEHRLHFRELTASQVRAYQLAERSQDQEVSSGAIARLIAASLCEPDGQPALTYERAKQLKPAAVNALVAAILSINGMSAGPAEKKA